MYMQYKQWMGAAHPIVEPLSNLITEDGVRVAECATFMVDVICSIPNLTTTVWRSGLYQF